MKINPLHAIDFYKTDHRRQYPSGTSSVYANFTARHSLIPEIQHVVFFGLQYFIKDYLINSWNSFFDEKKEIAVARYKRRMDYALGKDAIDINHIEALHDLSYLPISISALPEGSVVPIGIPLLTIQNTHPDFFWLTNYIESVMSCYLWKPITSATLAFEYKKLLTNYAIKTSDSIDFVQYQAHDFSFRGMSGPMDAASSGAAHLLSFQGTDSVLAIDFLEEYYGADASINLIGASVPATEHSVMCMGGQLGELETFRRLITEIYPTGIVSIVSDTWDFWRVITEFLPKLKDEIMARKGKVVIRPDSGDPVKIIAGDPYAHVNSPEYKGAVQCLWDIFGGTESKENYGYCTLDEHIGLIYGDSITIDRAKKILSILEMKRFSSSNIVFGVGSFTYQYVTRDTFGFAVKATSGVVDHERRDIFKDPKTDSGVKKSARGLLRVEEILSANSDKTNFLTDYRLIQNVKAEDEGGDLTPVFVNGLLTNPQNLERIRERLDCFLSEIINGKNRE